MKNKETHYGYFLDDLKSNFRSWENDHETVEDAESLTEIMVERHPEEDLKFLREWCYNWVGVPLDN